jgi:hypothetical protein
MPIEIKQKAKIMKKIKPLIIIEPMMTKGFKIRRAPKKINNNNNPIIHFLGMLLF